MLAHLRDRRLVTLRRIRPAEEEMLAEGLRMASPEAHLRSLGPKPRFTSRELRYLTEVEHPENHRAHRVYDRITGAMAGGDVRLAA